MKRLLSNCKIMAIAALSFRVFSSFVLLAKVGNENMGFEHKGSNKNIDFSSSNNRNLLEMRKDRPAIAINCVFTTCLKKYLL
ncbi:MAG TPA: hypothetical protein VJ729_05470 [Nitrososphaeraceae archaeon]|nr:hypothetical protein [Nitrososphaeraceae archaeon]